MLLLRGEGLDGGAAAEGGVEDGKVGAEEPTHGRGVVRRGVVGEAEPLACGSSGGWVEAQTGKEDGCVGG